MDNIGNLFMDAATLMLTGMGVVFIFLTILVYLVRLMSKLAPQDNELTTSSIVAQRSTVTKTSNNIPSVSFAISPQIIAAISTALHQHRTQNK